MASQNTQSTPAADPYAGIAVPIAQAPPAAPADPYAQIAQPIAAPPASADTSASDQPGILQRAGTAIVNNTPLALIKPPETPTEQVVHATSGDSGLAAYRAAKGLVGSVENVVKAVPETYANAVKDYQRMHQEFVNKDYRNAASSAGSLATDVAHVVDPMMDSTNQTRQLTEGARPGADLTTPLVGQVAQGATALAGAKAAAAEPGAASGVEDNPVTRMITNPFRAKVTEAAVQPALKGGLQDTWNQVADEAGVARPTATSIRDLGEQVGDAILARSKSLYRSIDDATGNRFSGTATKLQNVVQKLRQVTTDTEEQALMIEKQRYEMQIDQMFDEAAAKATGVTKSTVDAAKAEFKKAQAIYDINNDVRRSTKGIRPGDAGAEGSPETVNAKQLQGRLNARQDSGRLQQGVGESNGKQMIGHTGAAEGTSTKAASEAARVAKNVKTAKYVAGGAAAALGVEGIHAAADKLKAAVTP
jgi:hypothetical protein